MIEKQNLIKISDYLWEIPKSFRPDMRVPGRVYVAEKMLEESFKDKSLEQMVNVATLPGIQKYSLAMPDMHEGYGFPIGGVAAMDMKDGVISPGGVGYDISCIPGDTKILHSFGYHLPIKEFEQNNIAGEICCARFKEKNIEKTPIGAFLKRKANPCIYRITTKVREKIEATSDHPFYTPQGMIELKNLKVGTKIALYSFQGIGYQPPADKILIDEEKIKEKAKLLNQNPAGHGVSQIINYLKKRGLLPLKTTSPQLPYLLKIMGYLLGDGVMCLVKQRKRGAICFYGKPGDLKQIRNDIKKTGFTPSKIYSRKRNHKIKTFYSTYQFSHIEYSFRVGASSLTLLLWALGMPIGKKANQDWILPSWLLELPLWQKRLFLAAFFGAELSSPKIIKNHGFNFYSPVLGINKNEKYIKSGRKVLRQIAKILEEFGVKKRKIISRKDYQNTKKEISYRNRLILSSEPEDLINLWSRIGYEYNQEKQFLANLAVHFIKSKQRFIEKKILSQGIKARKGLIRFKKSQLNSLRNLIMKGGRNLARPFIGQFPTFKEFINQVTEGLGKSGMVWDEIIEIKKIPYWNWVYDFTVTHPDHNFIANNFVVSNCGMKLLRSDYSEKDMRSRLEDLAIEIQKEVPSGLGRGRQIKLDIASINKILEGGAQRLVEQGYGEKEDLENCESGGKIPQADALAVSDHAKNRGRDQVGTLGSGNHFLEIQKVDEIFDENVAETFGLFRDQIVIMIHTGSRGLGHQIATDYIRLMMRAMDKYGIRLPDRELAACPINSQEGKRYFSAMSAGANYAWANRQMIAHFVRKAWKKALGEKASPLSAIYDVAHNIAKIERHIIDGKETEVCLHRKGATRAFPPGHPEIPEKYRSVGQPVLIPGSMGTASYVLVGTKEGEEAFFSTCHGSGRTMSRHAAMRAVSGQEVINNLESKGIIVKCWSFRGIAEEAPMAYKNIHDVVDVVHNAGLSKRVARLVPLAVIKGE